MQTLDPILYGAVVNSNIRTAKNDKNYYQLSIRTQIETLNCIIWEIPENYQNLNKNDFVKISEFKDQRSKHQNITVTHENMHVVSIDDIPEAMREKIIQIEQAPKQLLEKSWKYLTDYSKYENPIFAELVKNALKEYPIEKVLTCPAAVSVHHQYSGGLVVHTAEVLQHASVICKSVNTTYKLCNPDIISVAATLHDMGKLETYYISEIGSSESTDTEYSIGHIFYSMELVNRIGKSLNVEPHLLNEIVHCIAAHHGKVEYGTIKEPMSLEAVVLSQADYISAKCGIIAKQIQADKKNNEDYNNKKFIPVPGYQKFLVTEQIKEYYKEI